MPGSIRRRSIDWVQEHISVYQKAAEWATHLRGEVAAEEAFDLTNNPGRESERRELWGQQRCLSVGDIVEVTEPSGDSRQYLCESIGWTEITT